MGEAELKAALQREADARIRALWQAAEERVAARRREVETDSSRLDTEAEQQRLAAVAEVREAALARARQVAVDARLQAESEMDDRLKTLAEGLLPELSEAKAQALWRALLRELPDLSWGEIRVCPEQEALAEERFPAARVIADGALGGGLVATSEDGRIIIDNSLRCRLLRAWPDLLPSLMNELRERETDDETAGPELSC